MASHNTPAHRDSHLPAERPAGAVSIGESGNHESSAVELRPIVMTTIAILLIVVVSDAALYVLYRFWQAQADAANRPETPLLAIKPEMQGPKLQVDERAALHQDTKEDMGAIEGYKWVEPDTVAAVPVEDAIEKIATAGALPAGPDWSLRPDERMVGGVILNPEQVTYANTAPSQALVGAPGNTPAPGQVGTAPADSAAAGAMKAPAAGPSSSTPASPKTTTKPKPKPAAAAASGATAQK